MAAVTVETERRLPYPPEDLCALVADIRAYPRFIPWMQSLRILREKDEAGVWEAVAVAVVGWRAFVERFTSRVRWARGEGAVDVALVEGPFRRLENRWRFLSDGAGGAVVKFWLAYEFKNPILQAVVSANKEIAAGRIMAAFEAEAKRRFSKPAA